MSEKCEVCGWQDSDPQKGQPMIFGFMGKPVALLEGRIRYLCLGCLSTLVAEFFEEEDKTN